LQELRGRITRQPPKQPYFVHMKDDAPFAFAGLWSRWKLVVANYFWGIFGL
jgi:putative SOS response-associated peptidase YedK